MTSYLKRTGRHSITWSEPGLIRRVTTIGVDLPQTGNTKSWRSFGLTTQCSTACKCFENAASSRVCHLIIYYLCVIIKSIVSKNALYGTSQAYSVNNSVKCFDWVFLKFSVQNYIAGILLTRPIGSLQQAFFSVWLLFNRVEGHGGGCTTALSGMHRYLCGMSFLTPTTHFSIQINGGTDTITACPHPRPNILILANRLWNNDCLFLVGHFSFTHIMK